MPATAWRWPPARSASSSSRASGASAADPQADIAARVAAYLELLERFLEPGALRDRTVAAVEATRRQTAPAFLPVNTFWGRLSLEPETVRVVSAETGATVEVASANVMTDRVVKRSVATPVGYVVDALDARLYRPLLARHGIQSEMLPVAQTLAVESCALERIEDGFDEVYNRYEGRQIVRCAEAAERAARRRIAARPARPAGVAGGGGAARADAALRAVPVRRAAGDGRRGRRRFRCTASWSQ